MPILRAFGFLVLCVTLACGSTSTGTGVASDSDASVASDAASDAEVSDAGTDADECSIAVQRSGANYQAALQDPKNQACTATTDCTYTSAFVCGGVGYVVVNKSFASDARIAIPRNSKGEYCIKDCGSGGGKMPDNIRCSPEGKCISD